MFFSDLTETMEASEEAGGKVQAEPMGIAIFLIASEEKYMVEDVWVCCEGVFCKDIRKQNDLSISIIEKSTEYPEASSKPYVNMTQHHFSVPSTMLIIWTCL